MFINAREAVPARITLEELGHKQPRTPKQIDNSTTVGVVNGNIQPRRTHTIDMRFYWLRDKEAQCQFRFYSRPGKDNLADYWMKHHCGAHHKWIRHVFLTPAKLLEALKASLARSTAKFSASY